MRKARGTRGPVGQNPVDAEPIKLDEVTDLQDRLRAGVLAWQEVQDRLMATIRGGRAWQTKEWKQRRAELIKDHCEQCGSTDGPFTLQHFNQPPSIYDLVGGIVNRDRWEDWQAHYEANPEDPTPITRRRAACPRCGGISILERKTKTPRYRCNTQVKGTCHFEFDDPVEVDWIDTRATASRVQTGYKSRREAFNAQWDHEHVNEIARLYTAGMIQLLDAHTKYMRMEETATFCKRCAYLWDVKRVRLCETCGVGYHPHEQEQCDECAGLVKMVLCKVCQKERHNDRYETCYNCRQERAYDQVDSDFDTEDDESDLEERPLTPGEAQALTFHEAIAQRLLKDPALAKAALDRVQQRIAEGDASDVLVLWEFILGDWTPDMIARCMTEPTADWIEMRRESAFASLGDPAAAT